ncbi:MULTISPECIES: Hint domain-containing protein [unclassified Rhizobium]|uniref:Hint domain-containing protein n=1 Tax=unclassified Rhizobium TaxID=2613769 RepID=UPI001ADAECA0|nr:MULTISPECIES: Hint domain-containing protein [unclassified Rhizobium]MBO9127504.1 Hint domain-containing protein [Rhizobium sp. 16-488-2b]MBO9177947.1 Hint domain-containing protein [Rhizobium sp. 16-488-2a]
MSSMDPNEIPSSRARRHFLGVAGATGAKLAGIAAVTMAAASSPARAMGRNWGPRGGGSGGGGNGGGGDGGGASCLLHGTSIKTPTGYERIEDLRIGDLVETVSGKVKPIRWIGHQTFRKSHASWPENVVSVRVAKDSLRRGVPSSDVYVSPGHAVYVNDTLVRAKDLVNGSSIAPALPTDSTTIEYFNIMLDTHDVITADGLPVETFQLRGSNYEKFDNFTEMERLYVAGTRPEMAPYAAVVGEESGRQHLKALLMIGVSKIIPRQHAIKLEAAPAAARVEELIP